MESFLVIGKPVLKAKDYAFEFATENKIDSVDISLIESEKAIGISSVREFQKKIYLKPYKSDKKIVILNACFGITAEAQNALLKVLEEPPVNTFIMLLSQSQDEFLPTIISRCKLIVLEGSVKRDLENYEKILLSVSGKGTGERLKLAQDYSKDKETALQFLEGMIFAAENILKTRTEILEPTKLLQETYVEVKNTNANLRLSLEHLLLNL